MYGFQALAFLTCPARPACHGSGSLLTAHITDASGSGSDDDDDDTDLDAMDLDLFDMGMALSEGEDGEDGEDSCGVLLAGLAAQLQGPDATPQAARAVPAAPWPASQLQPPGPAPAPQPQPQPSAAADSLAALLSILVDPAKIEAVDVTTLAEAILQANSATPQGIFFANAGCLASAGPGPTSHPAASPPRAAAAAAAGSAQDAKGKAGKAGKADKAGKVGKAGRSGHTYIKLCALALFQLGDNTPVSCIYRWIQGNYPGSAASKCWKSVVRHALDLPALRPGREAHVVAGAQGPVRHGARAVRNHPTLGKIKYLITFERESVVAWRGTLRGNRSCADAPRVPVCARGGGDCSKRAHFTTCSNAELYRSSVNRLPCAHTAGASRPSTTWGRTDRPVTVECPRADAGAVRACDLARF